MELFLDILKNILLSYIVYRIVTVLNIQMNTIYEMKEKHSKLEREINTCIENIETLEQNIIKVRDVLDNTRNHVLNLETEQTLKTIKTYYL